MGEDVMRKELLEEYVIISNKKQEIKQKFKQQNSDNYKKGDKVLCMVYECVDEKKFKFEHIIKEGIIDKIGFRAYDDRWDFLIKFSNGNTKRMDFEDGLILID